MASENFDFLGTDEMPASTESLLHCPVCLSAFSDGLHEPKLLPCSHSFCLQCLQVLGDGRQVIRCPEESCRSRIHIPQKGAVSLKTNQYIMQMRALVEQRSSPPDIVAHTETPERACIKHKEPLLFFCDTCNTAICMNCTVLDHDRNAGHSITDISAATQSHTGVLKSQYRTAEKKERMNKEALDAIQIQLGNLEIASVQCMEQLQLTFEQLKGKINKREEELMEDVRRLHKEKKNNLMRQKEKIKDENTDIKKIKDTIRDTVEQRNVQAMVNLATNETHASSITQLKAETAEEDMNFIQFDYSQGFENFISVLSTLTKVTSEKPLPAKISVEFGNMITGVKSCLKVTVDDAQGHGLCNYPIMVEISDACNDVTQTKMVCKDDGIYLAQFIPQMPGKHMLKVKFMGQVTQDMEFKVKSNNPLQRIGKQGCGNGEFEHPTSVALSNTEEIVIADMGNKRIQIFNSDGTYKAQFKVGGQSTTTYDVAMTTDNEIYVTKATTNEEGNVSANKIRVYGPNGEHKRQIPIPDAKRILFMAVNSKGFIVVTDTAEKCFYIISMEGQVLKKIDRTGGGAFGFPCAVKTTDDRIIIADTSAHCIHLFALNGKFIKSFGGQGQRKGQFRSPRGIATDSDGNILVADSQGRIQVFNENGDYISCIDSSGDKIHEPYNMAAKDGFVYVADYKDNCVKKYRYM